MEYGLISVFGAGLLTFLTPCVLPLVPIYLAVLAGGSLEKESGTSRGQLIGRALLFSVGFTSVFTVMGLSASAMGSALSEHGGLIQMVGAVLVFAFALKFLGVINLPFLDQIAKADESKFQTRFAGVNAVVMGVVFAAGWSPCVGPVLGSVLTYTATASSSPWVGAGYLSLYGLGFALPLILTAAFAEAGLRLIRRVSSHLPRIERGIGILMLAVAGYLAVGAYDELGPKVTEKSRIEALAGLVDESIEDGAPLPVMVELYTADCTVCKEMKPLIERVIGQCDRKGVRVKTIDVSAPENRHLTRQLRVVGVPTFLFVDEFGQEAARLVGRQTESTLKQGLSALRGETCPGMTVLVPENVVEGKAYGLEFPQPDGDEEATACRSTNTNAKSAQNSSKFSGASQTKMKSNVLSVVSRQKNCSQDLL
jgi:cytochrome c-type biogenesis protein